MKRTLWTLMTLLAVASPAFAGGYYADLFVGPNRTDDTSFAVLGTSRIATDFDTGMNYGVTFGYSFDNPWRIEGELMRREADVDSHDLDGGGAIAGSAGEANSTSLFANLFSAMFLEKYGYAKFRISENPKSRAVPMAMSEYPEKSQ